MDLKECGIITKELAKKLCRTHDQELPKNTINRLEKIEFDTHLINIDELIEKIQKKLDLKWRL